MATIVDDGDFILDTDGATVEIWKKPTATSPAVAMGSYSSDGFQGPEDYIKAKGGLTSAKATLDQALIEGILEA